MSTTQSIPPSELLRNTLNEKLPFLQVRRDGTVSLPLEIIPAELPLTAFRLQLPENHPAGTITPAETERAGECAYYVETIHHEKEKILTQSELRTQRTVQRHLESLHTEQANTVFKHLIEPSFTTSELRQFKKEYRTLQDFYDAYTSYNKTKTPDDHDFLTHVELQRNTPNNFKPRYQNAVETLTKDPRTEPATITTFHCPTCHNTYKHLDSTDTPTTNLTDIQPLLYCPNCNRTTIPETCVLTPTETYL